jgi:predicted dehydrogenase
MANPIDAHFYRLQVEGFAEAILENAPTQGANVDDGLAAAQALMAVVRSVENGDWVRLADATGSV